MPTSPEIPKELVTALAEEYLNDTRVVVIKKAFRDLRIEAVLNYCDNGTRQLKYIRTSIGPNPYNNPDFHPSVGWITE